MLCEKCHEQQATVHTTFIADGQTKRPELCARCFQEAELDLVRLLQSGCHYCGAEPHYTVPDLSEPSSIGLMDQKLWVLCERCAAEFNASSNRELSFLASGNATPEQLAGLPALLAQFDRHMKEWAVKRDL